MAWDADLLDLMPDEVVVRAPARPAADGSNAFSTAAASTMRARVTTDPKAVRDTAGNRTDVSAVAWVASTSPLTVAHRITLPDGTTPPIRAVSNVDDGDGQHHVKVMFGA